MTATSLRSAEAVLPTPARAADVVHQQVVRIDVIGDLVAREPDLETDVVFGIHARQIVEDRLDRQMVTSWRAGRTSPPRNGFNLRN